MPWYGWLAVCAVQLIVVIWVAAVSKKVNKLTGRLEEDGKQEKLLKLYRQIEEMLDSFEEYVGEMHEQLEEKRAELVELNRQAQVMYLQALDAAKQTRPEPAAAPEPAMSAPNFPVLTTAAPEPGETGQERDAQRREALKRAAKRDVKRGDTRGKNSAQQQKKNSRLTDKDYEALERFATKAQKVRFLMSRGLPLEEVARELDIGKGEVLLITDLDKT